MKLIPTLPFPCLANSTRVEKTRNGSQCRNPIVSRMSSEAELLLYEIDNLDCYSSSDLGLIGNFLESTHCHLHYQGVRAKGQK